MPISPVPSTRVSDLLVRQRLITQLNADQSGLVDLQTQLTTGKRITLPSDDVPAALRALTLQDLLNRKDQVKTNLATNQSFLSASDSALSQVSDLLTSARATALSAADAGSSSDQRLAGADQINLALQQLVNTANQNFRGRYLFAGSQTNVQPFEFDGSNIRYNGNQGQLSSYSDTNQLFQTNSDGDRVFGAISKTVGGAVDLNPVLSAGTRLADLHGGAGVHPGSVAVSDGSNIVNVDLTSAETLGDVADLLAAHAPPGRTLTASITSTGLNVQLDSAGGGTLTIKEVGGGTTAGELGILHDPGSGTGPVTGADLDPRVTLTTSLGDLLGTRASARVTSAGANNDLLFTARQQGSALNNVTVAFVNNPAINQGGETVAYDTSDPANPKLTFQINSQATTANDVIHALANDPTSGALFQAALVNRDNAAASTGRGLVETTATADTSGGSGTELDQTHGLQIVNAGKTYNISLASAKTVEDLLNQINGSSAGLLAEINSQGTGINLRSRLSGADFSVGENGGTTATQLGIRSFTAATALADLNHGLGVHSVSGNDFTIRRKDDVKLQIDVTGARTIGDVLDLINNNSANTGSSKVTARLATVGNGIELVAGDSATAATLSVQSTNQSLAAQDLGLIPIGASVSGPAAISGSTATLTGRDTNPGQVDGVFDSLIRLRQALVDNDNLAVQQSIQSLDAGSLNVTHARSEIGARQQGLDAVQTSLDNEVLSLKQSLSKEIDADLPQLISELTARQASFQASLQTTASLSKLTLLNYL